MKTLSAYPARAITRILFVLLALTAIWHRAEATPTPQLVSPSINSIMEPGNISFTWTVNEPGNWGYIVEVRNTANFILQKWGPFDCTTISTSTNAFMYNMDYNLKWRVIAIDIDNPADSVYSGFNQFSVNVPNDSPQLISPANQATGENYNFIRFSWEALPNADYYEIYISSSQSFPTVTNHSMADNNYIYFPTNELLPNTTYYWKVVADSSAISSPTWSFTTGDFAPIDSLIPVLEFPNNGEQSVNRAIGSYFDWSGANNPATSFRIQFSTNPEFSNLAIDEQVNDDKYYLSTALNPDTKYYWRVRSVYPNIPNELWSDTWSFYTDGNPLTISIVSPLNGQENVNVNNDYFEWTAIPVPAEDIGYYDVLISEPNTCSTFSFGYSVSATRIKCIELKPNTYYEWTVRGSYYDENRVVRYTDWTQKYSFRTAISNLQAPVLDFPVNDAQVNYTDYINLIWNSSETQSSSFRVQVSDESDFTNLLADEEVISNTYAFANPNISTPLYWRVLCYTESNGVITGQSPWSSAYSFTVLPNFAQITPFYPYWGSINLPTTLNMVWGSSKELNSYTLQVCTDSFFVENNLLLNTIVESTNYNLSGLQENTVYWWRVKGNDPDFQNSPWSYPFQFTTGQDVVRLLLPECGSLNLPTPINLVWDCSSDISSYFVQVCADSAFNEDNLIVNTTVNGLTYALSELEPNLKYSWRVKANNPNNPNIVWSEIYHFSAGDDSYGIAPIQPANGSTIESSIIEVTWSAVSGAQEYRFQMSSADNSASKILIKNDETLMGGNAKICLDTMVNTNKITLNLGNANKAYYWRTYAKLNETDSTSWTPAWTFNVDESSSVKSVNTIIKAKLTPSIANSIMNLSIQLSESSVVNINIYNSLGEVVSNLGNMEINNGVSMPISVAEHNNGAYFLKIEAGKHILTLPFVISR